MEIFKFLVNVERVCVSSWLYVVKGFVVCWFGVFGDMWFVLLDFFVGGIC